MKEVTKEVLMTDFQQTDSEIPMYPLCTIPVQQAVAHGIHATADATDAITAVDVITAKQNS